MNKGKAIQWKFTRLVRPSSSKGETFDDLLLCSVYNGYPDGDLEYFYTIGSYRNGKFYDVKNKRYHADYWAKINEPHAWECDPPYDVLGEIRKEQKGEARI
jgi:hypothetical protein